MIARKISHDVLAVSDELLTASSRLYGLTGVSPSGPTRPASVITENPHSRATRNPGRDHIGQTVAGERQPGPSPPSPRACCRVASLAVNHCPIIRIRTLERSCHLTIAASALATAAPIRSSTSRGPTWSASPATTGCRSRTPIAGSQRARTDASACCAASMTSTSAASANCSTPRRAAAPSTRPGPPPAGRIPTARSCGYYDFLTFERKQQDDKEWVARTDSGEWR